MTEIIRCKDCKWCLLVTENHYYNDIYMGWCAASGTIEPATVSSPASTYHSQVVRYCNNPESHFHNEKVEETWKCDKWKGAEDERRTDKI